MTDNRPALTTLDPVHGRIAVYSCYFGNYEPFFAPAVGPDGAWDRIIFTDHAELDAPGCRVVHLPAGFGGMTAKELSRLPKLWPERFFAAYDWVIYIDNRAQLLMPPDALVARITDMQGGTAPAGRYLVRHRARNCSWREAKVCLNRDKLDTAEMARLHDWFKATGLPRNAGLYVNTALIQKMGSDDTARLNEAWFNAFVTIAGRDQVLLPNVMRELGLPQHELGMPLAEFAAWPMFGFRVRRQFQRGLPLPDDWDKKKRGDDTAAAIPPQQASEGQVSPENPKGHQLEDFKLNAKLSSRLDDDDTRRLQSAPVVVGEDGMKLYHYGADGSFDLALYRKVQTEANKMKIKNQWVSEGHIAILSRYMQDCGVTVAKGICHGTRRGNEQLWFRKYLGPQADVFGTEISDTATDFPHTIQWDFHDVDPDWIGAMDVVYSNSWDHAFDPERAFTGWIASLRPGGFLMLDHGWCHQPGRVTPMDPFGIPEDGLVKMLNRIGSETGAVMDVIDGGMHKHHQIRSIIFRATL